jgi:hypothetical protein
MNCANRQELQTLIVCMFCKSIQRHPVKLDLNRVKNDVKPACMLGGQIQYRAAVLASWQRRCSVNHAEIGLIVLGDDVFKMLILDTQLSA